MKRLPRLGRSWWRWSQGQVQGMLDAGVIQPPISERASAPVLVRKKDGKVRWCLDYMVASHDRLKKCAENDIPL